MKFIGGPADGTDLEVRRDDNGEYPQRIAVPTRANGDRMADYRSRYLVIEWRKDWYAFDRDMMCYRHLGPEKP